MKKIIALWICSTLIVGTCIGVFVVPRAESYFKDLKVDSSPQETKVDSIFGSDKKENGERLCEHGFPLYICGHCAEESVSGEGFGDSNQVDTSSTDYNETSRVDMLKEHILLAEQLEAEIFWIKLIYKSTGYQLSLNQLSFLENASHYAGKLAYRDAPVLRQLLSNEESYLFSKELAGPKKAIHKKGVNFNRGVISMQENFDNIKELLSKVKEILAKEQY